MLAFFRWLRLFLPIPRSKGALINSVASAAPIEAKKASAPNTAVEPIKALRGWGLFRSILEFSRLLFINEPLFLPIRPYPLSALGESNGSLSSIVYREA